MGANRHDFLNNPYSINSQGENVISHVIFLHRRADEGNREKVVLNNSLTNEATPVRIDSSQQKVAVHLNRSTKCKMKKTLTLVLGLEM